ncbi:helix-turn-helix domain-containing protein [Brucella intermedia]|uniref:helix-turn-helix domain-containing protein n=1 Tax=Brucella intermedia TaxID=94625 RepID=UPI000DD79591|nr:helix-turn-helix transcriptional regulator [Brucella intermedia]
MTIREIFARNLRKLRHANRLSQEKLAHLAGIDRTYVSSLERSIYSPTIDMVATLATILGVPPEDLLRADLTVPVRDEMTSEG